MSLKKQLNKEQLEKVNGGSDATEYADIKCVITYKYLGIENTEAVVLKVVVIDKAVYESDVLEAIHNWCDLRMFEYVAHSVKLDDGAYYRYVMLDK